MGNLPYRRSTTTVTRIAVAGNGPGPDPPRGGSGPGQVRRASGGDEVVGALHDRRLDVQALVLVLDASVVHLDRERTDSARRRVLEVQRLGALTGAGAGR